ncbi:MAG: hypothetical protein AAGF12_19390 [Myxococcota bacterium]
MRAFIDSFAIAGVAMVALLGCTNDTGGNASLVVRADALAEARDGISTMQTADGFSVEFDHVVLALEGFFMQTTLGDAQPLPSESAVVELVPSGSEVFRFEGLEARRWDNVGFSTAPAQAEAARVSVDDQIVDQMVANGWSQFVSGTMVSPDGMRFPFEFGFPVRVDYVRCRSGRDGTDGVVLPDNGQAQAEITWHLTHLFFDSFAEDSSLRVEPIAAMYDGTNPVTIDQLSAQPLADVRGLDGQPLTDDLGNPVLYIPPAGGAETLREFVLSARFAHFDGLEGFCNSELTLL